MGSFSVYCFVNLQTHCCKESLMIERLYSTIVYIFNVQATQCLFLNHRKLGKWLPPGGKVDPNELPENAAIRECFEETGLKVKLLGKRSPCSGGLLMPEGMQLNTIVPGVREHIDFIYVAIVEGESKVELSDREALGIQWFALEKILDQHFNTFESTKQWVNILSQKMAAYIESERMICKIEQQQLSS